MCAFTCFWTWCICLYSHHHPLVRVFASSWDNCSSLLPSLVPVPVSLSLSLTQSSCCPRSPLERPSDSPMDLCKPALGGLSQFLRVSWANLEQSSLPQGTATWRWEQSLHLYLTSQPSLCSPCLGPSGTCYQSGVGPGLPLSFSGSVRTTLTLVGQSWRGSPPPRQPLTYFLSMMVTDHLQVWLGQAAKAGCCRSFQEFSCIFLPRTSLMLALTSPLGCVSPKPSKFP